jgi:hypothetical protein
METGVLKPKKAKRKVQKGKSPIKETSNHILDADAVLRNEIRDLDFRN